MLVAFAPEVRMGWRPIETAPKDGTIIALTWEEDGMPSEYHPMRWCHIQRNGMFPGKVGMWTAPDGSYTWNDDRGGGPTHWAPHEPSSAKHH